MENTKEIYLYEMGANYPGNLYVRVINNGYTVFTGIVSAIPRFMNAENLARKVNVYVSKYEDHYRATAYLQR